MRDLTDTLQMPVLSRVNNDGSNSDCLGECDRPNFDSRNMQTLKEKLRRMWMAGDYGHFAQYMASSVGEFFGRLHIQPGTRMLDVACGAGQLSVMAARAGAIVTGLDLAANSLEQARVRAAAENLKIDFAEGDAESLPYADESFDLVVSLIGAMFAPRPALVASEMVRACRPGGQIAMGNWTPGGFVGRMFEIHSRYVKPPAEVPAAVLWGSESVVRERLGSQVKDLRMTKGVYRLRYPFPPADVVEFYRICYGPTNHTFAALGPQGQAQLRRDLEQLWSAYNLGDEGKTDVVAEYLAIAAIRI